MIGGRGLAEGIWALAQSLTYNQVYRSRHVKDIGPWPRDMINWNYQGPSREFYRLTGRAWYAWTHRGILGFGPVVKL